MNSEFSDQGWGKRRQRERERAVYTENEHMSALISSLAELLFAFCALVLFLFTVGEHVSDYVISE